ncbi:MAG TPA: GNAT family N-acetyltransferase [Dactylosporangium sp.]|nr:GNAT family N-acetyltransferase [Dactylosporangium sp.]
MDGFGIRAYEAADAGAVAALVNAVFAAGGVRADHAAAEIEELVEHEIRDPATDTRLVVDADGRLAAAAFVPAPPDGGYRLELIGGVLPEWRGAGIGRALLAWQLERAASLRAEVAPGSAWTGQVVTGLPDASAVRLYERLGFAPVRYFLKMVAPIPPASGAAVPEGVRLMRYTQSLERDVHALHSSAFRGLWGHQERAFEPWAAQTVRSERFLPDLARVAFAGDAIVGYVLPYRQDEPGRLYVGQIGTAESWRRRGVAGALLADMLAAAAGPGYTAAALDADADNPTGAAAVYLRAGFKIDQHLVAYTRAVS